MRLRTRSAGGDAADIDRAVAVELVDEKGGLAVAIVQEPSGLVRILTAGDPAFHAYANNYGMRQARVAVHEPRPR
jgi:hypothetical protein